MPLLEVDNLCVHYGAIQALHGVTLSVEKGQIVALLGCNGAGKSTTLRAISGLLPATSGSIRYDSKPLNGSKAHEVVGKGIAQVPEGRGIFPNFTVEENLKIGSFVRTDHDLIRKDFEHVLTLFPRLKERLKQNAGTLSGGEQQMLAIARALLARPKLLLLDEPSLGLAPQLVKLIFDIIRKINSEGTTILLVEQNASMALEVAHHAYVLEVGAVVMSGDAKKLARSDEVKKAYLGMGA
ncbi:MAG: ABC transporter ATP-binding protein [Phycisphaeraceae bacterium]